LLPEQAPASFSVACKLFVCFTPTFQTHLLWVWPHQFSLLFTWIFRRCLSSLPNALPLSRPCTLICSHAFPPMLKCACCTHLHTPSHTLTHPHTPSHTLTHPHTPSHNTLTHPHTPSHTLTHPTDSWACRTTSPSSTHGCQHHSCPDDPWRGGNDLTAAACKWHRVGQPNCSVSPTRRYVPTIVQPQRQGAPRPCSHMLTLFMHVGGPCSCIYKCTHACAATRFMLA
jgi:hypothetical protein